MNDSTDYLYNLLPVIYRQRDAEKGYPLRDLLRIINEQVNVVQTDISQLYANWFIETCDDWVVPYIGDLIAYQPVYEAGEPGDINTSQGRQRNKILIPRREVANTIRYRRRKGTLALLELLANDVAGWSARAVEFYKLLGWTQHLNHLRLSQGRRVDLRQGDILDKLDSPFDEIAHTVDVRRVRSPYEQGRYNISHVGVFIWRLKTYSVTKTPACCLEEVSPNCYTFSILGHDIPLYNLPQPETEPTHIAEEINLPVPISRRALKIDKQRYSETGKSLYYGENKSLHIWLGSPPGTPFNLRPIPYDKIIPADLSEWQYQPSTDTVAVDPVLGRIVFPSRQLPKGGVWVSYQYAFSADIGGGEYHRRLQQPAIHTIYRVGKQEEFSSINQAFNQWQSDCTAYPHEQKYRQAVIEISDSGVYTERFDWYLQPNQNLQLRAANRKRPVIRLLDYQAETTDSLHITLQAGNRLSLDGLLIVGRGVQIQRGMADFLPSADTPTNTDNSPDNLSIPVQVTIRHSTLVPGWSLQCDCEPKRPAEASLELYNLQGNLKISHSILGSIKVYQDEVQTDPISVHISDSIIDATHTQQEAIDAPGNAVAHAKLTIQRCTVLGKILTHSIQLAENSIFDGCITVARRQEGCMRFCSVTPDSRTPRRYNCQPDLVKQAASADLQDVEAFRVRPIFNSTRYGNPTYCQLSHSCAEEIKRGADDESEMGVFHDLYQPQREANLRARLDEYAPSGMETGIIYIS
ncbi:hypothetical protein NIES4101_36450 [Calothrix sp. NIES-4101]|nr:hypothetical protein NIES4101_36450 [Calothrix sp. NIES-4101]